MKTYCSEYHMQREGYVEVECIIVDDTDKEVEGDHYQVLADGNHWTNLEELGHKHKALQGNEEKLEERNNVACSWIIPGECIDKCKYSVLIS